MSSSLFYDIAEVQPVEENFNKNLRAIQLNRMMSEKRISVNYIHFNLDEKIKISSLVEIMKIVNKLRIFLLNSIDFWINFESADVSSISSI